MKKTLFAASVLACCAGMALGQTTQPQFWLWHWPCEQPPCLNWDNDHQFSPMLRILVGSSPASTATNVAAHFQTHVDDGWIDPDNYCLLLLNSGNPGNATPLSQGSHPPNSYRISPNGSCSQRYLVVH
jgi:hypothetical protein